MWGPVACVFLLGLFSVPGRVEANGTRPFVRRDGTHLMAGDQRFYFLGASCYYLAYWAGDTDIHVATGNTYRHDADIYLQRCRDYGFNVIRIWAFNDGDDPRAVQPSPGVHSEQALQGYDYVLSRCAELDLRVVMTLVNNWDDFGGMRWYVTNSPTATVHSDFYTDAQCRAWYTNHVAVMVTRTNSFNGRVYRDDPAIFAWQLANEPRWDTWLRDDNPVDTSGMTIRNWVWDMAAFIKRIDTNHMVSTGEEGWTADEPWEGTQWELNNACPDIDYTVIHCWPDWWQGWLWGEEPELYSNAMAWVADRLATAATLNKPMVLSEYGKVEPLDGPAGRHAYYQGWFDIIHASARSDGPAAGLHFWMLEADGSTHTDGFEVQPTDTETLALLEEHAWWMNHVIAPDLRGVRSAGGPAELRWDPVVGGPRYEVLTTTSLTGGWHVVGQTGTNVWTVPTAGPRCFYRLRPYWP